MNYQTLSLVYDRLTGDRGGEVDRIRHLLKRYNPNAQSVIEFACGSGAVLKHLKPFYKISGLDLSTAMLKLAKKQLRNVELVHGSMTTHRLDRKFDIALCLFDSINHVLTFKDWKLFFANAARHLNPGGILCFDINTVARLNNLVGSTSVAPCGKDFVIFKVMKAGVDRVSWNIDVFKHQKDGRYELLQERIKEVAFPVRKIKSALKRHFAAVVTLTSEGQKTSRDEGRIFFICTLKRSE